MYVNEKKKGNAFKEVRIPSKAEYFARFGLAQSANENYDAEHEYNDTRKMETLEQLNNEIIQYYAEQKKQNTQE